MIEQHLRKIRLVITDVDGILTDGTLIYGPEGEALKKFHARDGIGFRLLQKLGIAVAVSSGRDSAVLRKRMKDLGVEHFVTGSMDKITACQKLMEAMQVRQEETLFIGDDIADMAAFACCGLGVTVPDAPYYVRSRADIVLSTEGGKGAFRELADMIVRAYGREDLFYPASSQKLNEMNGAQ